MTNRKHRHHVHHHHTKQNNLTKKMSPFGTATQNACTAPTHIAYIGSSQYWLPHRYRSFPRKVIVIRRQRILTISSYAALHPQPKLALGCPLCLLHRKGQPQPLIAAGASRPRWTPKTHFGAGLLGVKLAVCRRFLGLFHTFHGRKRSKQAQSGIISLVCASQIVYQFWRKTFLTHFDVDSARMEIEDWGHGGVFWDDSSNL